MLGRVQGKVALVTGGAKGLGKAISKLLAKEGADVFVTDMDEAAGRTTADSITKGGKKAFFYKHNVALEYDWKKVVDKIKTKYGRLDIAVNNAGVGISESVEQATLESWRKVLSINLDGVFLGTQHAIELMKPQKSGSIINLSSIEGLVGDPSLAAYNASKGGVKLFSMSAALHVAKDGIRVNTIHPGYIETEMVINGCKELEPETEDVRQTSMYQSLAKLHPVGHLGNPDDIAYGTLYLASDESKFVTGTQLVIDGGYTAQ